MSDILKYGNAIRLAQLASDPAGAENGTIYYNTVSNVVRQYVNGAFADVPPTALTLLGLALNDGNLIVGNGSNLSVAVDTASVGDIDADSTAGLTIKAGVIVDADINASAAIALSKLASLTASKALQSDGSGVISASSVTSTELGYVSGVTSAIQTQLGNKVSKAGDTMSGNLAMGGNKVTGLGTPSASGDAATKGYVDSVAEGLKPKAAVKVATTANITIATDLNSGDSIDGVTLADGDRVLVKDQTAAEDNGIWIVDATPYRATDFDSLTPIDEVNGAMVPVQEGTVNTGKIFVQSGVVATIGTDPINFVFFNSISNLVGGDGITISGTNVSVDHDGEGLQFVANQLALELDGSTLSKSSSGVKVATGGISNNEINASAAIDASKIADGSVSNTEFQYLDGVTSAIQTQLGGKANTTLNNLGSTAVNANIIPDTTNTRDLGSSSVQWNNIYSNINNALRFNANRNGSQRGQFRGAITSDAVNRPDGVAVNGALLRGGDVAGDNFTIYTANNSTADAVATTAIDVQSGNKTAGTGNSGDIALKTGTSVGGARGKVTLDGLTVEPRSNVIPDSDNTRDLGSTGSKFASAFLGTSLVLEDPAGGNDVTIAAATGTAAMSITLLSALPGATEALTITSGGVIGTAPFASAVTGDIAQTTFSGLANNTANQTVTGLAFANGSVRSARIQLSIFVDATADSFAIYDLMAIQRGSDWQMSSSFTGDSISGLSFDITSAGQVRASIGNISGFSSADIKFRAWATSV